MTIERPNITSFNIEPECREELQRVGDLLRQLHRGRGGMKRGLEHIVKVYQSLPEDQRQQFIVNDKG